MWDHTVLPATQHKWHKWTCPAITPANRAGTYPRGMEGWVDLGSLVAAWPGIEPTADWLQVQSPTVTPPSHLRVWWWREYGCHCEQSFGHLNWENVKNPYIKICGKVISLCIIHRESKNGDTILLSISSPKYWPILKNSFTDTFSRKFKDPVTPQTCH